MVRRYVEQERQRRRRRKGRKERGGEGEKEGGERGGKAVVDKQERGMENHQTRVSYNPTTDVAMAPLAAAGAQREAIPLYLEPYRAILPPSLMPATSRTAYPHTLLPEDTSEWG